MLFKQILSTKSKNSIIGLLARNPEREYTFKEIANEVRLSYGTVHPALASLANTRILTTRKAGRSILYKINERHPLFHYLKEFFVGEEESLIQVAEKTVKEVKKEGIKNIVLFGSVARGKPSLKSDIDLLVIYRGSKKEVEKNVVEAIKKINQYYDVIVTLTYLSVGEALDRKRKFDKFILTVLNEGKVLYGGIKWLER